MRAVLRESRLPPERAAVRAVLRESRLPPERAAVRAVLRADETIIMRSRAKVKTAPCGTVLRSIYFSLPNPTE